MRTLHLIVLAVMTLFVANCYCQGSCISPETIETCIHCLSSQEVEDGILVVIDASTCKEAPSISWICCTETNSENGPGLCEVTDCVADGETAIIDPDSAKCSEVSNVTFLLPPGTTDFSLQIHDGRLSGNVDCSTEDCCGNSQFSDCGFTVMNIKNIDVSSCDTIITPTPTPIPTPTPTPTPTPFPTPTATPSSTPSSTPSPTPTINPSPSPIAAPIAPSPSPVFSPIPSPSPTSDSTVDPCWLQATCGDCSSRDGCTYLSCASANVNITAILSLIQISLEEETQLEEYLYDVFSNGTNARVCAPEELFGLLVEDGGICNETRCGDTGLPPGAIAGIIVGTSAGLVALAAVSAVLGMALLARRAHHAPPLTAQVDVDLPTSTAHNEVNPLHNNNHIVGENALDGV